MKVLIVGSGGREHALAWRISRSPQETKLWVAGGNTGTAQVANNLNIHPEDLDGVLQAAQSLAIELVVIGPEQPLNDGIVDRLGALGIPAFGPSKAAAQLEGSKSFAREILVQANVPGPDFRVFDDRQRALDFLARHQTPVVVKADGLAAGKGVALCATSAEAMAAVNLCMADRVFGTAGDRVVIEELLTGAEVSVFGFCDGENLSALVAACDYKQARDGDQGPNTGGIGSFTPPAFWNSAVADEISRTIMGPVIAALAQRGAPYRGMLYAGLMFTESGPKVLEFNCRFGDPETQVILPLLESDPVQIMLACAEGHGELARTPVCWGSRAHVGVVMASGGYPGPYDTGFEITGLDTNNSDALDSDTLVFHAGTDFGANPGSAGLVSQGSDTGRQVVTNGGRVLTVVGRGDSLADARTRAYQRVRELHFRNAYYRTDIGDLSVGNRNGVWLSAPQA